MEYLCSGVRKVYFSARFINLPLSAYLFEDQHWKNNDSTNISIPLFRSQEIFTVGKKHILDTRLQND
jgi:hypothetical protein